MLSGVVRSNQEGIMEDIKHRGIKLHINWLKQMKYIHDTFIFWGDRHWIRPRQCCTKILMIATHIYIYIYIYISVMQRLLTNE